MELGNFNAGRRNSGECDITCSAGYLRCNVNPTYKADCKKLFFYPYFDTL